MEASGFAKKTSFQKRKRNFIRKQQKDASSDSAEEEISAVVKVQRKRQKKLMRNATAGSIGLSKDPNIKNSLIDDDKTGTKSDSDEAIENKIEEKQDPTKVTVRYDSSRTGKRAGPDDMGATSIVEIDTEFDRDAQAIFEKHLKVNKDGVGEEDDKLYKGQSGYARYYEKKDTAQGNAASGMVRYVFTAKLHWTI